MDGDGKAPSSLAIRTKEHSELVQAPLDDVAVPVSFTYDLSEGGIVQETGGVLQGIQCGRVF